MARLKGAIHEEVSDWAASHRLTARSERSANPDEIKYTLHDFRGEQVGKIGRKVIDGEEIYNDIFTLDPRLQGNGMGSDLTKRLEKRYRKEGVKRISLHANIDVGSFAWARKGFDFDWRTEGDPGGTIDVAQVRARGMNVLDQMVASGQINSSQASKIRREFEGFLKDMDKGVKGMRPTPAQMAMLGSKYTTKDDKGKASWFGKQMMTGKGAEATAWHGVKRIRRF